MSLFSQENQNKFSWIGNVWKFLIEASTLIALIIAIRALYISIDQSKIAQKSFEASVEQNGLAQKSLEESNKQSKLTEQSLTEARKQSELTEQSLKESIEQSKATAEQLKMIGKLTESLGGISNALLKDSMLKLADRAIGNDMDGGDAGSFDALSSMKTEFKPGTDLYKFADTQWNRVFFEHKSKISYAESHFNDPDEQIQGWVRRARDAKSRGEDKDGNQNVIRKQLADYVENDPSLAVRVIALRGFYQKCNRADSSGGLYNFQIIKQVKIPTGSKIPGTDQNFESGFICDM